MESDEDIGLAATELAAATMAQIHIDRERLTKLWIGLNRTELVIRRGQLAYLESTELLSASKSSGASGKESHGRP